MLVPIRADLIEPEEVEWLWRDRIPRSMLWIVGGKPDQGKGLFMAYLAATVSNTLYEDPDTGKKHWGRVLYSATEDLPGLMTRPRLEAAGANLKRVDITKLRLPADEDELYAKLSMGVDLLVMDPLASHLSHNINRHSDNIRKVTDPLSEIIGETRTSVGVVEHVVKNVSRRADPLSAIGGSNSGLVAACRMAFMMGTDPKDGDRKVLCCVKHNLTESVMSLGFEVETRDISITTKRDGEHDVEYPVLVAEEQECQFNPMSYLVGEPGKAGRKPERRAAACEWLTNHLYKNGKMKAGQVFEDAKQFNMSAKVCRAAAKDLDMIIDPPGGGRNCTWELPPALVRILNDAVGVGGNVATNVAVDTTPIEASPAPPIGRPDGEVDGEHITDDDLSQLLAPRESDKDGE